MTADPILSTAEVQAELQRLQAAAPPDAARGPVVELRRPHWHVGPDPAIRLYDEGRMFIELTLAPEQALAIAADLIRAVQRAG